ncbi:MULTISPECIES: putative DNA modification/repair radical SAM protein [unclassified Cupriavidus]|uniref:putative DNA modification/repair radical SAM protein n=1 Tax=unclassified Cupriavidus TaxID=2640874 RepID=UPI001C002019|nr:MULTISPECIES: putative DNA modification/repair radical SAM protein [unclassified Cupriavidus]MCA3193792.1 putative DNA modification/repair radical SAM protein [Cupriavidus sp.]MCA3196235.1 putative DNA modification/repair radical SAM protein [Cupriavidus sp.]MCA3203756.1 putative DNA modification/repair radical SAM protein [Cupriavidus sp.]MCA3205970.1 putative DNA modification/repair radical SAM protein [Cupriavidus sp.]MCA3232391.1 putative DNA modification/repair radical SAM protein [Cup
MELLTKLEILADAAKYDASCASSGAPKRDSVGRAGLGATTGMGICHSFTPDGRCVSLLKILLTNVCQYDCQYCVNRRSSNVPRARFQPGEVVDLTMDFYRRNYIDGLFLSSGIIRSADYTMEQLVQVARELRETHQFRGYIHLKTIPDADPRLITLAGQYADRLSVNIELPTDSALQRLAPEKNAHTIKRAMGSIRLAQEEAAVETPVSGSANRRAPAGQSTQMIVGADDADDRTILQTAQTLYGAYRLKRVYYSAFSPIPDSPSALPAQPPPLLREHRLYQADFLLRGYGFRAEELFQDKGALPLDIDPKLAWALAHRDAFPVDLNRAPPRLIARVPGIGLRNAKRLATLRRERAIRYQDLIRLRCAMDTLKPFIIVQDYRPATAEPTSAQLRRALAPAPEQLSLL